MSYRNSEITASTDARYSKAISSYFSSQGSTGTQKIDTTESSKYPRTTSRYRASSFSSGIEDQQVKIKNNDITSSNYDSDDGGYQPSSISRSGSAGSSAPRRAISSGSSSGLSSGKTNSVENDAHSSRTYRMLSSQQFSSNSITVYQQPTTLLELLKQPLLLLDPNVKIEKFNEDKGDLEVKTRTPTVKVLSKRDPSTLQIHSTNSRTQQKQDVMESTPAENNDYSPNAYQPRVPSRKASATNEKNIDKNNDRNSYRNNDKTIEKVQDRSTSRVSNVSSAKGATTTNKYGSDQSSRAKSMNDYSDTQSQKSDDGFYTEIKPKQTTSRASSTRKQTTYVEDNDYEYSKPRSTNMKKESSSSQFEQEEDFVEVERGECPVCGRKFAFDRLDKHIKACKVSSKPRKQFDISKKRLDAEARQIAMKVQKDEPKKKNTEMPANKMPKWKRDHLQFQQILRAGRPQNETNNGGYSQGGRYDGGYSAPQEEIMDDRVPCPHCGRKFNSDVADRHIPRCRDIINKPKTIKRGEGNAAGVSALTSRSNTKPAPGPILSNNSNISSTINRTQRGGGNVPLSSRVTSRVRR